MNGSLKSTLVCFCWFFFCFFSFGLKPQHPKPFNHHKRDQNQAEREREGERARALRDGCYPVYRLFSQGNPARNTTLSWITAILEKMPVFKRGSKIRVDREEEELAGSCSAGK